MNRHWKKIVGVLALLAVLAVGGFLVWFYVIKEDAPPALTTADLDAALADTSVDTAIDTAVDTGAAADSTAATVDIAPTTTAVTGASSGASTGTPSGMWTLTPDSTLGYRIQEVVSGLDTEAAGRTNDATGTLTIDGSVATAAEFTVNMASMTSDSGQRDNQFRTRIMTVDEFPTSTFVLTQPIDFGAVPAEGVTIPASATGDLTLRGVTNPVTFDVQAKLENGRIGVLGNIPILFSDYDIPDPSNQIATVKDNGLLEFVLVFEKT